MPSGENRSEQQLWGEIDRHLKTALEASSALASESGDKAVIRHNEVLYKSLISTQQYVEGLKQMRGMPV